MKRKHVVIGNALLTASTDTAATYPVDGRLPNGLRIQMPRGRVSRTLYEVAPPGGWYNFWVVGAGIATGQTTYSVPVQRASLLSAVRSAPYEQGLPGQ